MSHVRLESSFETRYWMQVLGVTRFQLEAATKEVGTQVEMVMDYLSIPDRRVVRRQLIVAPSSLNPGLHAAAAPSPE